MKERRILHSPLVCLWDDAKRRRMTQTQPRESVDVKWFLMRQLINFRLKIGSECSSASGNKPRRRQRMKLRWSKATAKVHRAKLCQEVRLQPPKRSDTADPRTDSDNQCVLAVTEWDFFHDKLLCNLLINSFPFLKGNRKKGKELLFLSASKKGQTCFIQMRRSIPSFPRIIWKMM